LWAGLPLITTAGETFASRVAASLLHTAGLDEWIFNDPAKAFQAIIALASDPRGARGGESQGARGRAAPRSSMPRASRAISRGMLLKAAGRHAA
jgi:predicted O-linked N-acetylglucosamine transferase (SPINDLY family)